MLLYPPGAPGLCLSHSLSFFWGGSEMEQGGCFGAQNSTNRQDWKWRKWLWLDTKQTPPACNFSSLSGRKIKCFFPFSKQIPGKESNTLWPTAFHIQVLVVPPLRDWWAAGTSAQFNQPHKVKIISGKRWMEKKEISLFLKGPHSPQLTTVLQLVTTSSCCTN